MDIDLLIKNGTIVDPARNLFEIGDIAVVNGWIVKTPSADVKAARIIDAEGCLVVPGLIDFHSHIFTSGTELGVDADTACLPQGVTTVVDVGSAGISNYDSFVKTIPIFNQVHVFSFVNMSATGLITLRYHEDVNPQYYDAEGLRDLFRKHPGQLIGLKIRQSQDIVGKFGLEPLKRTVQIAEEIGCKVVVHVTDPPCLLDELADVLRPGDIFCHMCHGTGKTIIGDDGKVLPGIKAARKRGVIFDAANGKMHFSFEVARAAIADGFLPDVISTDLTPLTLYADYVFGLPFIMSKYLSLGVDFIDILAACTSTPAKLLGMQGKLGTLAPGALADIAVFKQVKRPTRYIDTLGETFVGEELLIPQMTVLGGHFAYRQIYFDTQTRN